MEKIFIKDEEAFNKFSEGRSKTGEYNDLRNPPTEYPLIIIYGLRDNNFDRIIQYIYPQKYSYWAKK